MQPVEFSLLFWEIWFGIQFSHISTQDVDRSYEEATYTMDGDSLLQNVIQRSLNRVVTSSNMTEVYIYSQTWHLNSLKRKKLKDNYNGFIKHIKNILQLATLFVFYNLLSLETAFLY